MIYVLGGSGYTIGIRVLNYDESEQRYTAFMALGFIRQGWV